MTLAGEVCSQGHTERAGIYIIYDISKVEN